MFYNCNTNILYKNISVLIFKGTEAAPLELISTCTVVKRNLKIQTNLTILYDRIKYNQVLVWYAAALDHAETKTL